jgi:hypothetical protein
MGNRKRPAEPTEAHLWPERSAGRDSAVFLIRAEVGAADGEENRAGALRRSASGAGSPSEEGRS